MRQRLIQLLAITALLFCLPVITGFSPAPKKPVHHNPMILASTEVSTSTNEGIWGKTWIEVYKSETEILDQHNKEESSNQHYPRLVCGDYSKHNIAITIDDGPHPDFTPKLLAILNKYNIKVTFFVVGAMAEKYPQLVTLEAYYGNVIGNHSFNHVDLTQIPVEKQVMEWRACNKIIKEITGKEPRFCRPPGGDYNRSVMDAAMNEGLIPVLWTDNSGDYQDTDLERVQNKIMVRAYNGGIILMHDGVQQTIDLLPALIEKLQAQGYKFVTVEEMAKERGLIK